jgi:hypothetical protein
MIKLHKRKISLTTLMIEGLCYRIHNIVLGSIVFYIMYKNISLAFASSIGINLLHMFLYYHFHFWFSRYIKLGRGNDLDYTELRFRTNDIVTDEEYEVSLDNTFVAFPGLQKIGQRLEAFFKKKGAKYGDIEELGTLVIKDGKVKIIQW